jgi:hypothetical protein
MPADPLEQLLEHADAQLPPRPATKLFAERVRARAARRAKMRIGVAMTVLVAAAMITAYRTRPKTHLAALPNPGTATIDVAQCRIELAQLDALATVHQRAARRIMQAEDGAVARRRMSPAFLPGRDPLAPLAEAQDRAARILLLDGDRLEATPGEQPRAQAVYRRAVQLFPDTPAAREAADRLKAAGA